MQNVKIVNTDNQDITNRVKFQKCWIITINSVLILWEKLSKLDFMYLKTRRLTTDYIEHFFYSMRQQSGNNVNPIPIQFQRAFRKLFCQNYFHSSQMNCRDDLDEILINIQSTNTSETVDQEEKEQELKKAIALPDYNYTKENITTQNAFSYVCGYILKKALEVHNCDICKTFGN